MCGLLGVLGPIPERSKFAHALRRLKHRGPDGEGIWQEPGDAQLLLGHRRLAILDASNAGLQPMTRGSLTLVFNGEIYNYIELRQELESYGLEFSTGSDTEVVLAAFSKWGADCLLRFNGMWSIALWNSRERSLFLSRDRFGKKPLFYAFEKGAFLFGSEMKALMPLMDNPRISDHARSMAMNLYRYESGADCLIHGIKRFPAGSFSFLPYEGISTSDLSFKRYWNTVDRIETIPDSYPQQVERFRELFLDACRIRLRSDVPVGTALSGGLDSSAVTLGVTATGGKESLLQKAFVACFPDSYLDERKYAEAVAKKCGIETHYLNIKPEQGLQKLPNYLYLFEEIYSANPIPMMEIYSLISKCGVRVSIDGHGGDELLSGYDGFLISLNDAFPNISAMQHILHCTGRKARSVISILRELRSVNQGSIGVAKMLWAKLSNIIGLKPNDPLNSFLNKMLYDEFHFGMLPTLLRNYDRYSMASGVEIRMPFLDYRLVQYCFSLPWTSKIPRSSIFTKAILRDALSDLLPQMVLKRNDKIGFSSPVGDWLKGPWREWLMDITSSQDFFESRLIDSAILLKKRDDILNETTTHAAAERFWGDLSPYLWEQYFFRRACSSE